MKWKISRSVCDGGGEYWVKTMTPPDHELLKRFRTRGDEAAFTELVNRHLGLVHSAALRITSKPTLAEEVSQTVFTKLAQLRSPLRDGLHLVTWLHQTTRSSAIDLMRAETRRRRREQTAASLSAMSEPSFPWESISPVLDEVIGRLSPEDRHLVLSRFFEGRSHAELARSLGLSEDAARMRVSRALEKVRHLLQKRGIATTATALAMALPAHAVTAVPTGLAASVSATALAASAAPVSLITLGIITMTKKTAIAASAALLIAAAGTAVYISSDSKPAAKEAGNSHPAPSSAAAPSASTAEDPATASRFRVRERPAGSPVSAEEADLVSRYGEARVKLAKRITGKMLGFLGDEGLKGFMPLIARQGKQANLAAISQKLALTDAQKPKVDALLQKDQDKRVAQLDNLVNQLNSSNLKIAEVLLAGDAFKRGDIQEQDYKDVVSRLEKDQAGVGDMMKMEEGGDANSLMADPVFSGELKAVLDPSQIAVLDETTQPLAADAEISPNGFDVDFQQAERLEDLDQKIDSVSSMFDGMKKIMEGMQAMEALQATPKP